MSQQILMTPGPVPLPPEVLEVLAQPMEHHRTPEFMALFARVLENLRKVYVTSQAAFIHTSTGSGAMESAIVNTLSPGDHVVCVVSGKFGERWADMAEVFGARVTRLNVEWGQVVRVDDIRRALANATDIKAVFTQACETSTGVLHPIREIGQAVKKTNAILVVDAITALGALPMPMEEWDIDVMIGGSQKAFMLPTGLSFISFSKKAWALTETSKMPKFYFDIRAEHAANQKGESVFSTSVTPIRALDVVLKIFLDRGLHRVQERIQALSKATLMTARSMGLRVLADVPSPSVSALVMPEGFDSQKVRAHMEKNANVIVMGGQDQLKNKIIRIGHMGAISNDDMRATVTALAEAMNAQKPDTVRDVTLANALRDMDEILKSAPAVLIDSRKQT